MKNTKVRVYLAGPWFTARQNEVLKHLESTLSELDYLDVYSPSRDGIKLDIKSSTYEDRQATFDANVKNIDTADVVVAYVGGNDTGTLFEIGYAKGFKKRIIYYDPDHHCSDFRMSQPVCTDENDVVRLLDEAHNGMLVVKVIKDPRSPIPDELSALMDDESMMVHISKSYAGDYKPTNDAGHIHGIDLLVVCIDDRPPLGSEAIGSMYASYLLTGRKVPVYTYSLKNYVPNIMLLHSISNHYTDVHEMCESIKRFSETGVLEVNEDYAKSAKEFE